MKLPFGSTGRAFSRKPGYSVILKILTSFAMGSFFYVPSLTLRSILFGTDGGPGSILFFAFCMFLGHLAGTIFLKEVPVLAIKASASKQVKFVAFMLDWKDAALSLSSIAAWGVLAIPCLSAILIHLHYGVWRVVLELVISAVAYGVALKHSQFSFTRIMEDSKAYAAFVTLIICLELLNWFPDSSYLKPWVMGISYLFIFIFLVAKNQEDIDNNIFDKKHIEKSILPGNLRRLNTFWVCMLFLAILLLFNLKPMVVFLMKLAVQISVFVASVLGWLLEQLFASKNVIQQSTGVGASDFFGSNPETIRPMVNLISGVLRNALLLYLIYRLLLLTIRWIPMLIRRLSAWIKKLLSIQKGGEGSLESMDYSDETETIKPVKEQEHQKQLKKRARRNARTLKGISDPVERVRFMYASILSMLPTLGVHAAKSDTTADILRKTDASPSVSKELSFLTPIYNQVRYGEKVPDGEMLSNAEKHFDKAVEGFGQK